MTSKTRRADQTTDRVPRSFQQLAKDAGQKLRPQLEELLSQSSVLQRQAKVVTATPYQWDPLPREVRPLQNSARRMHLKFLQLVTTILREQPSSVQKRVANAGDRILAGIDQDKATIVSSSEDATKRTLTALDTILELVEERACNGDSNELIVVPDTSGLYFSPALDSWRFPSAERLVIALVLPVGAEVEEHKDTHPNPNVVAKAKGLVRQFHEYHNRGDLIDGVSLVRGKTRFMAWPDEPDFDSVPTYLDMTKPDDGIIGAALDIARHSPVSPIAVVTQDLNMRTRCALVGLSSMQPPEPPAKPPAEPDIGIS